MLKTSLRAGGTNITLAQQPECKTIVLRDELSAKNFKNQNTNCYKFVNNFLKKKKNQLSDIERWANGAVAVTVCETGVNPLSKQ
jgi:hypothetical protein